jgi:hypothetical protein
VSSPTARSLDLMRRRGYIADVAEKWIEATKRRRDLFGFCDVVALRIDEVVFVQSTTDSNVAARLTKIREHKNFERVRRSGVTIVVHGWKRKQGTWLCREVWL